MAKTRLIIILAVGLIFAAVAFFIKFSAIQKNEKAEALPPAVVTQLFQRKNPPFNFTFEHPEAWRVAERSYKGEYDMVEVMGVIDKDPVVVPGIFITKKPLQANDTAGSLMESWLKEEGRYEDFRASLPKNFEMDGQKGLQVDYSYKIALPLRAVGVNKVTIKKRQMVVVKGSSSYQITFMGTDEQFKTYLALFNHGVNTFKFLD